MFALVLNSDIPNHGPFVVTYGYQLIFIGVPHDVVYGKQMAVETSFEANHPE